MATESRPATADARAAECVVCRETMKPGVRKCIRCGAFQSWVRRRLDFSGTILSLLVALVSVTTFAIPSIREAFHPNAEIHAAVVGGTLTFLQVMVTNTGSRPGIFRWARIAVLPGPPGNHSSGASAWGLHRVQNVDTKAYDSFGCTSSESSGPFGRLRESHSRLVVILMPRADLPACAVPASRV